MRPRRWASVIVYERLTRQIEAFTAWQELPAQAELHGMAPLLWHHIHQAGISIPLKTEQTLKGLYLRHRIFNQAHTQALLEITALFEQAGIRALVLKGLALAYQYYPDPALRPVSDIDLLLKTNDILPALDLLAGAGFRVDDSLRASPSLIPKELTADSPLRDGISAHVELHHYDPRQRSLTDNTPDHEFTGFDSPPHSLTIGEGLVYAPDPMDTLRYLFRHFARHHFAATASRPLQLKWVADIISLVERHAETMDWAYLRRHDPSILNCLEVFYSLTPLPERHVNIIPIRQIFPPAGINQYPKGWPQQNFSQWKRVGFLRFAWQTLTPPSNWWLRLCYGIGDRSVFWYGQVIHRLQIFRIAFRVIRKR
ncbi:MAG: nucleotidyltransferase family protein [Chloroflexota bacterium]